MIALVSIATLALAAGCGKESGASSTASRTNTSSGGDSLVTAPVDYLNTISKQKHDAVKKIDVAFVNQAIQLFQVQEGRNPRDLNELVEKKYLAAVPETPYGTRLDYDAEAGTVKVVNE